MPRVLPRAAPPWVPLALLPVAAAIAYVAGGAEHILVLRALQTLFHFEQASLAGNGAPVGNVLIGLAVLAADFLLVKFCLDRLLAGWERYQRRDTGPPWVALAALPCAIWLCWNAAVVFGAVVLWAVGLAAFLWWMMHAAGY